MEAEPSVPASHLYAQLSDCSFCSGSSSQRLLSCLTPRSRGTPIPVLPRAQGRSAKRQVALRRCDLAIRGNPARRATADVLAKYRPDAPLPALDQGLLVGGEEAGDAAGQIYLAALFAHS